VHRAKNLGYVRLAGRMVYLGRANSPVSHERYRCTLGEWLATGQLPQSSRASAAGDVFTVASLAAAYLRWARTYYVDAATGRASAGLGPLEAGAKALCALYGQTAAAAFGPLALRAVRAALVADDLCRNVVNQRVACVKRAFRWAVSEQLVAPSVLTALAAVEPLRRGRSGARETAPVRPVPDAHVEAVLPYLPPTLRAMVRLQRLTGMRSGELCALRTADVDRGGGAAAAVWLYAPATHKTAYRGQRRVVCIGPRGRAVLGPFLRPHDPQAWVFSPAQAMAERRLSDKSASDGECGHPKTCPTRRAGSPAGSGRYNSRSYHRALRYAMRAATVAGTLAVAQYWHPHQLRHLHATAIRREKGLEAARVLLGHRTVDQTLDYAEADVATARAIAAELG
jgi:integrase